MTTSTMSPARIQRSLQGKVDASAWRSLVTPDMYVLRIAENAAMGAQGFNIYQGTVELGYAYPKQGTIYYPGHVWSEVNTYESANHVLYDLKHSEQTCLSQCSVTLHTSVEEAALLYVWMH